MISVIIPAHNEAAVIGRSLLAMTEGATPGDLEVLVVCNGCTDATAAVARGFGPVVRVIETDTPSKTHALNLGDAAATGFPRLYVDADVVLTWESIRRIAAVLQTPGIMAASPAAEMVFPAGTSWMVRAYYRLWTTLPYVREGLMAAGVYAVNEKGRQRFGAFPDVIADDGYVRLQFTPEERMLVKSAQSRVSSPATLWQLIRIKTRSRLGYYQLRGRCPQLFARESQTKRYGSVSAGVLRQPRLWPCVVPYLLVNAVARYRARRQLGQLNGYVWERDDSSRAAMSSDASIMAR